MGLTLATEVPTDRTLRRQYLTAQARYAAITGKRPITPPEDDRHFSSLSFPKVPKWDDAGKPRKLDGIVADRIAAAEKDIARDPNASQVRAVYQTEFLRGYVTAATNGHWLMGKAGTAEGRRTYQVPADRLTLTADHWRAYSRVRTCRPEGSQAVSWEMGDWGTVLRAGNLAKVDHEAAERVDGPAPTGTILLDDRYVWPLRGIGWELGITADGTAACLTYGEYAVLIMGMRR